MNVTSNITNVPTQEASLVDATPTTPSARQWIQAHGLFEATSLRLCGRGADSAPVRQSRCHRLTGWDESGQEVLPAIPPGRRIYNASLDHTGSPAARPADCRAAPERRLRDATRRSDRHPLWRCVGLPRTSSPYAGAVAHPQIFDDDDPLLARVRKLAAAFPGTDEKVSHGRPAFFTKKVFAYYGSSLKVDGEWIQHPQSIMVQPDPDDRPALLQDPRAFVPAYLGPSGWIGYDLDDEGDWDEVAELLDASFRLTAPRRLVSELDDPE